MRVCVQGLWHLGSVTAACLAAAGHDVVGLDPDTGTIERLREGHPPVLEPGLEDLLERGIASGRLRFSTTSLDAIAGAEVLWVTYDTPVDENDEADVECVVSRIKGVLPLLPAGITVLVSSQLPVGSIGRLEQWMRDRLPNRQIGFASVPENLRLGKALEAFMNPARVVVGVRLLADRERVERLLSPITRKIEWMSVESAEMTKHAINAFLATSITFANEIASLCERVGADAKEVER
jgi:UDPglucose 6-dehydrogenase